MSLKLVMSETRRKNGTLHSDDEIDYRFLKFLITSSLVPTTIDLVEFPVRT